MITWGAGERRRDTTVRPQRVADPDPGADGEVPQRTGTLLAAFHGDLAGASTPAPGAPVAVTTPSDTRISNRSAAHGASRSTSEPHSVRPRSAAPQSAVRIPIAPTGTACWLSAATDR
jgi:hypothetical protein